ncbi:ankyrin repeat domain-containing protein [Psychrobacter urativorans]|nr:ankyrin repeat domain-containing protein [Psychrobacter urativorans]
MKIFYKMSASVLISTMLLTGCSSLNTHNTVDKTEVVKSSQVAPIPQVGFRYSDAENFDLANEDKLSWRIFYDKPSTGTDAKWFDAVKRGDLATIKYMVNNGQDLEAKDTGSLNQTALGWAAFIGYEDIVDYLVDKGADIYAKDDGDVYNVMKSAVLGGNTVIVKKAHRLLSDKAPVNLNDQAIEDDGETFIMVAASNNRIETVKYLLAQGANPNLVATTQDKTMQSYNQSAYSYACTRGHVEMQKLLASKGVVNHRTGKASCQ